MEFVFQFQSTEIAGLTTEPTQSYGTVRTYRSRICVECVYRSSLGFMQRVHVLTHPNDFHSSLLLFSQFSVLVSDVHVLLLHKSRADVTTDELSNITASILMYRGNRLIATVVIAVYGVWTRACVWLRCSCSVPQQRDCVFNIIRNEFVNIYSYR